MTLGGRARITEQRIDTQDLIRTADVEVLLTIATSVHQLRIQPLVRQYNNPNATQFFHKQEDLRRLITQVMRNDLDARARIVKAAMQMLAKASPQGGKEQSAQGSQGDGAKAQAPPQQ